MKETLYQNGHTKRFLFPQRSPSRKDREKDGPRSSVTILYCEVRIGFFGFAMGLLPEIARYRTVQN